MSRSQDADRFLCFFYRGSVLAENITLTINIHAGQNPIAIVPTK